MQESRWYDGRRFGIGLAQAQVAIVGQDHVALFIVPPERILRGRVRQLIQRRVDSRNQEKKTDEKEGKNFE